MNSNGKNIVICCDGTSNQISEKNTNVVYLFEAVEKHEKGQVAFYDPGVGTFSSTFMGTKIFKPIGKLMGAAFGYGVTKNIEDAYRFLMDTYEEGDRIFLFGFSRGAFTVRSLSGILHKSGLLYPGNDNLVPYAINKYHKKDNFDSASIFKQEFSRECVPYFIGVWDTVKSLGWLLSSMRFHDTTLDEGVSYAYHALAIDEVRRKFQPEFWDESRKEERNQTVEQVWFPGVHSDVGGGYDQRGLANCSLLWMLENAESQGLKVNLDAKQAIEKAATPTGKKNKSYTWKWWLLGKHVRQIPKGAKVHKCVQEKEHQDSDYKPNNLPNWSQLNVVGSCPPG